MTFRTFWDQHSAIACICVPSVVNNSCGSSADPIHTWSHEQSHEQAYRIECINTPTRVYANTYTCEHTHIHIDTYIACWILWQFSTLALWFISLVLATLRPLIPSFADYCKDSLNGSYMHSFVEAFIYYFVDLSMCPFVDYFIEYFMDPFVDSSVESFIYNFFDHSIGFFID